MKSYSNLDNDIENNYNSRKNEHFENRILNPEKMELNQMIKIKNKLKPKQLDIKIKCLIYLYFFFVALIFVFIKLKEQFKGKKGKKEKLFYNYEKPFLPLNKVDIIVKPFNKTYYNSSNIRYHFQDLYENRKIFKLNYDYLPYTKINKQISFDENAINIYENTGILNLTKLNMYYYNQDIDTSNFNHIHVGIAFDKNYILLTTISMASLLNTSSPNTYIHFHFLLISNIEYKDLKPLIDLKKINKNVEFVFYNGKQSEYDFGEKGRQNWRGVGDYSRLTLCEIVNNTNKILALDCGDIIVKKDLSELYFFDIGDNYIVFTLEDIAGRRHNFWIFGRNNFYPNGGACLVNIKKFREDNLYKRALHAYMSYNNILCPFQEIFMMIINYKFKYWPLNYNCPQFFRDNEKNLTDNNSTEIKHWLFFQEFSPFKYSKQELLEASRDPVILHLYKTKPFLNMANTEDTLTWINYAKLAGVYDEVKVKYPKVIERLHLK